MKWIIGERASVFRVGDFLSNKGPNIIADDHTSIFEVVHIDHDMQLHIKVVQTSPDGILAGNLESGNPLIVRDHKAELYCAHRGVSLEEGLNRL